MVDQLPEPIRCAIAQISGIPGVVLESSPEYVDSESSWGVRLRLTVTVFSEFVPAETCWVALVDCIYPDGRIRIYPAQIDGLIFTFPHQDRNIESGLHHASWRTGKPCLDSPSLKLGRIAGGPEPIGDAEQRFRWHVERCLAWLEIAARDQLMVNGEPFEVPQCSRELLDTRFTVIHDEGNDTWQIWNDYMGHHGEIHWGIIPGIDKIVVAEEFFNSRGDLIRRCRRQAELIDKPWVGYWWLWPSPIVIPPWHVPGTWQELRQTGARLNVDVDGFIQWMARNAGGKEAVIVLLGYPIPPHWHESPVEIHWQAILPPNIPARIKPMNGFRDNPRGRSVRLRRDIFSGTKKLSYLKTSNWHPNRLQARGRFSTRLRTRPIAVIGVGALGSAVAELLARGGVTDMLIIDHDDLEAGNLVRHTLTGADLGNNKATATVARLKRVAPMSRISCCAGRLPRGDALQTLLEPFDIVLDCTGDDDVLRRLGAPWWSIPRYFLSTSVGFAATHLCLFGAHACSFPFEDFEVSVRPWLAAERTQWSAAGETLEGAGCWSPLFPARSDDVWLAAVATVKYLERAVEGKVPDGLRVFEQRSDEGFTGYKSVDLEG